MMKNKLIMRQNLFPVKSVLLMSLLTIFVACSDDDTAPMPQPRANSNA